MNRLCSIKYVKYSTTFDAFDPARPSSMWVFTDVFIANGVTENLSDQQRSHAFNRLTSKQLTTAIVHDSPWNRQ
jgi:hypothetical protein